MKGSRQKRVTKEFFNRAAGEWFERTYDPDGAYLKFPSNRVRMELALDEIARHRLHGAMLDLGCGTGQLVMELLRKGNRVHGIDMAERMIEIAKKNFKRAHLKGDPDAIFQVKDLIGFSSPTPYRAVTALGLLEYLEDDQELFSVLAGVVGKGGYAFVEGRNKFFNLFSANRYTRALIAKGSFPQLLKEFAGVSRYSPEPLSRIPSIEQNVSGRIARFFQEAGGDAAWFDKKTKSYRAYPSTMVRRQHTPRGLEKSARPFGFCLEYVVYWHLHPYLPQYEQAFPKIFNRMSYLMGPLGRTAVGASSASSFLAVLRKS